MKVPANIISENLYTIGKEFVFADSYKEYQGYYYEISDKFFAGREFNTNAPRLLKLNSDEINSLRLNSQTSTYASLKRTRISSSKIPSIPLELTAGIKYLAKQANLTPIRIIFTTEKTYREADKHPEFIFVAIDFEPEFGFKITNEDRKAIPEIDTFLAEFLNFL
jgi:hypothetical protein